MLAATPAWLPGTSAYNPRQEVSQRSVRQVREPGAAHPAPAPPEHARSHPHHAHADAHPRPRPGGDTAGRARGAAPINGARPGWTLRPGRGAGATITCLRPCPAGVPVVGVAGRARGCCRRRGRAGKRGEASTSRQVPGRAAALSAAVFRLLGRFPLFHHTILYQHIYTRGIMVRVCRCPACPTQKRRIISSATHYLTAVVLPEAAAGASLGASFHAHTYSLYNKHFLNLTHQFLKANFFSSFIFVQ